MSANAEPVCIIERLYRREYDGVGDVHPDKTSQFITEAISSFYTEVSNALDMTQMECVRFDLLSGKKSKTYDKNIDLIPGPPYYLWCRCCINFGPGVIKDYALYESYRRGINGMLVAVNV